MSGFIDPDAVREQAERLRALAANIHAEADALDDLADLLETGEDDGAADDAEAG